MTVFSVFQNNPHQFWSYSINSEEVMPFTSVLHQSLVNYYTISIQERCMNDCKIKNLFESWCKINTKVYIYKLTSVKS